jgi:hypothetical protein
MNTIIEQIPDPELVAEKTDSRSVAGAIADGSQAIAHDGFDVETFEQAVDDYARLGRTVEETASVIRTGSALLRDLFWSFHKRSPRVAPVAPLSPAHEINREILEQILSTTEWREMRESGTVDDPLSSAIATIGCAASAVAALDKETIRYLNQLHELTGEVEQLFARAEALDELAALALDKDRSEWLKKEASRARTAAEKKGKRAERLRQKLEESSEGRRQNVRRTVRQGLAEAMAEVGQANDAINAYGGGYDADFGSENGAGGRNSLSTKEKLVIAQQVGHSPKLQRISSSAQCEQIHGHRSSAENIVGRRLARGQMAQSACLEPRREQPTANVSYPGADDAPNAAAGCSRGSARGEIPGRLQWSYTSPIDIRRAGLRSRNNSRSGFATDALWDTSHEGCRVVY